MAESSRRRIQVHLPSGRKFLQIARNGDRIADLAWAIATKASVLYDEGRPVVRSLKDQYGYDVDPEDFVFDVFDDRDRCYVQARPIQMVSSCQVQLAEPIAKRPLLVGLDRQSRDAYSAAIKIPQHPSPNTSKFLVEPQSDVADDLSRTGADPLKPLDRAGMNSRGIELDNFSNKAVDDTIPRSISISSPKQCSVRSHAAVEMSVCPDILRKDAPESSSKAPTSGQVNSHSRDHSNSYSRSSDDDQRTIYSTENPSNMNVIDVQEVTKQGEKSEAPIVSKGEPSSASDWSFSDSDSDDYDNDCNSSDDDNNDEEEDKNVDDNNVKDDNQNNVSGNTKNSLASQADADLPQVQSKKGRSNSLSADHDDQENPKNEIAVDHPHFKSQSHEIRPGSSKPDIVRLTNAEVTSKSRQIQIAGPESDGDDESWIVSFSSDDNEELLKQIDNRIKTDSVNVQAVNSADKDECSKDSSFIADVVTDTGKDPSGQMLAAQKVQEVPQDLENDEDGESSVVSFSSDEVESQPEEVETAPKVPHVSNDADNDAESSVISSSVVSSSGSDDESSASEEVSTVKDQAKKFHSPEVKKPETQSSETKAVHDSESSVVSTSEDDDESSIVSSSSESEDAAPPLEFTKFREVVSAKRQPELLTSLATGRQRQVLKQPVAVKASSKHAPKCPTQERSSSSSSSSSSASAVKTIANSKTTTRTRNKAFLSLADDAPMPKHAAQSMPERSTRLRTPKSQAKSKSLSGLRANLQGASVLANANKKPR